MRRDVRILLVGDDDVGKSTLITSLIKETFIPDIQHVVPEVTIPPEITPDNVTTQIVDSSARPEHKEQLDLEIRKAHVICVVYAINDRGSFDRIPQHWLPYIRGLGVNVPVVLVGNKIDLRGDNVTNQDLEDDINPIMNEFKEVETCVECSSKHPLNVSEVFYFAQKAVLHPTSPLYDSREHKLKPKCVAALTRIFRLCDQDKDDVLDDYELNEFQRKCFDVPLQQQEVEGVKEVVREVDPSGVNEKGLTVEGFIHLHTMFVQRGRLETTWTVLRQFGYDDDLALREDFLYPVIEVPPDCSVELSPEGYDFFTELFTVCDKDKDGALNDAELAELFSATPSGSPPWPGFPHSTITNEAGSVTLQGFLAQWSLTTLLDYRTTLAHLAYLGYKGDTRGGLLVTKPKRSGKRGGGRVQRDVFLCYVLGAAGSGKTSLLRAFVEKPYEGGYQPTAQPLSVVNSVAIGGSEKYLVMQEVGSRYEADLVRDRKALARCDLLCFVYDSGDPNSFSHIVNLRKQYNLDYLPSVFVATKSDSDLVMQKTETQPDVYCRELKLPPPHSVSAKCHPSTELFHILTSVAMNPSSAIPGNAKRSYSALYRYARVGGVVAVGLAVALFVAYKLRGSGTSGETMPRVVIRGHGAGRAGGSAAGGAAATATRVMGREL